jgi:AraC family transcriptional regulator
MDSSSVGPPGASLLEFRHDIFFGDLRWSRGLDGITLSHRIATAPPDSVRMHTHLDAHFVLVTGGHYVSSATGRANPHSTFVYNPPGTTHRDHFIAGRGAFFSISLAESRLAGAPAAAGGPVALHLHDNSARGLAVALLMEGARWNASSPLKTESLCLELLGALETPPRLAAKSPPRWLYEACELIYDCAADTPGIQQLAGTAGVHPTHLARAFRTFLGCTPGDLLRARRLELAACRLLASTENLAQISLASGFCDQAQFTKAFRRLYGVPPGRYRDLGAGLPQSRKLHFDKTAGQRLRQARSRRS